MENTEKDAINDINNTSEEFNREDNNFLLTHLLKIDHELLSASNVKRYVTKEEVDKDTLSNNINNFIESIRSENQIKQINILNMFYNKIKKMQAIIIENQNWITKNTNKDKWNYFTKQNNERKYSKHQGKYETILQDLYIITNNETNEEEIHIIPKIPKTITDLTCQQIYQNVFPKAFPKIIKYRHQEFVKFQAYFNIVDHGYIFDKIISLESDISPYSNFINELFCSCSYKDIIAVVVLLLMAIKVLKILMENLENKKTEKREKKIKEYLIFLKKEFASDSSFYLFYPDSPYLQITSNKNQYLHTLKTFCEIFNFISKFFNNPYFLIYDKNNQTIKEKSIIKFKECILNKLQSNLNQHIEQIYKEPISQFTDNN